MTVRVCRLGTLVEAKLLTVKVVLVAMVKSVKLVALNVPELVNAPIVDVVILLTLNVPELVSVPFEVREVKLLALRVPLTVSVPFEVREVKLLAFKVPLTVSIVPEGIVDVREELTCVVDAVTPELIVTLALL